ncbi:MAG: ATP-binding cassette domain-containing protein [Endomicrobium sp.]|jgi:D-methionine transport system ATP-binding protein|nr:ATP-binding cassette domain-containing protein [Endomicrobium sp.]
MAVPFIEIKNVFKIFTSHKQEFEVLKGINLDIEKGDIFGIVGFSGAGKSTLIRCINGLETISSGSIRVGKYQINKLAKKDVNIYRQKIGMVFQHFNLFDSRTVYGNVSFPLEIATKKKEEIHNRVLKILDLVGIVNKKDFYPGQLSGGQKQRVGIARALANHPSILLSDEATSALDPVTSMSVLDLLKDINKKLGLTIILITHSLDVVKYTCKNMAVLENGIIAEKGSVKKIFENPQSTTAKVFIKHNAHLSNPYLSGEEVC